MRWYHIDESLVNGTPASCARALAEWVVNSAPCRRIVTGRIPHARPTGETRVPLLDDGRDLLEKESCWGELLTYARQLREVLIEPVPDRSAWEMQLCVALTAVSSLDSAARLSMSDATTPNSLLTEVLDAVPFNGQDSSDWPATLAGLALARTDVDASVVGEFASRLDPTARSVLEKCLLHWNGNRAALHPLVRREVLTRTFETRRRTAPDSAWNFSEEELRATHDRLSREYRNSGAGSLRDDMESLHHELLGNTQNLDLSDPRIRFVEQLAEIGRTLSYWRHQHRAASRLFGYAVQIDPSHAYSHHYLAFNLDWLAERPDQVEEHYRKAAELQPTHPWWWSRWISYLATRGRFHEAKVKWREALVALSVSEDAPDWIFFALHRWVARWLLHWGELDFAKQVLQSIPKRLAGKDPSFKLLLDLLQALQQAEQSVSVFPLSVRVTNWWSPMPHTDLPPSWQGRGLRDWMPARVEWVDPESSVAFLVAARRPAGATSQPEYVDVELARDELSRAAHGFEWADVRKGALVELGYYDGGPLPDRIGLHRDTSWHDPHLPALVPPPDRWYRSAVESAWSEHAESD
jgi:tetratricopeptide (TPR) repeat protein